MRLNVNVVLATVTIDSLRKLQPQPKMCAVLQNSDSRSTINMNTAHTEISLLRCFLCRRKISATREQKQIDSSTCPASKKTFRDVLAHLARHAKTELHVPRGECICLNCYRELVEYDSYLMKALRKQRILLELVEKAVLGIDSDFEDECDTHMAALDELTDDHFFDDAHISDSEIDQTIAEATGTRMSQRNVQITRMNCEDKNDRRQSIMLKCDLCAMKFKSKVRLQKHITQAHKKFSCELCNYSHRNEDHVLLHMNIHEGKNENQCRFCEKEFTTKISTIRHMEVHFNSKKYQCDKCGLCFSQTTVLYNHKLQHEAEEQPLQCEVCSQVFKTKRTYRHHMIIHRTDRPRYSCEYCSKTFTEKYTLKVHKRTHPEALESGNTSQVQQSQQANEITLPAAEAKFNCIICDQLFGNKEQLNKHMEKEHDVILKSLTLSNYSQYEVVTNEGKKPCHICGQMFSAQANLEYHLKHVHTSAI